VDFDGQIINLENTHIIKVSPIDLNSSVGGTDFAKLNDGVSKFDNLIFRAETGRKNVKYR